MLVLTRKRDQRIVLRDNRLDRSIELLAEARTALLQFGMTANGKFDTELRRALEAPRDNTMITVVEIRGDKTRIGIEAPKLVDVHRLEIWQRIHGPAEMVA